jgi:hypothetical protein
MKYGLHTFPVKRFARTHPTIIYPSHNEYRTGSNSMPLSQPYPVPERLLVFGPAGSSKTTGILNIAKFAALTQSDAQFYIGDSDGALPRMMTGYPTIQDRVHISPLYDWPDYVTFGKLVLSKARPQDWVSVDFISNAWSSVQSNFVESIHGKGMGDYFVFQRKADAKTLEGWTDWNVINAMHRDWLKPLIFKGRYHLYCTAMSDQLSSEKKPTESKEVRSLFLPYGVKPAGQKELPFQFHSLLLAGKSSSPVNGTQYTLTTVKDRERSEMTGKIINNFTMDYLVDIAGWKVS